jgi:hypothetical protein
VFSPTLATVDLFRKKGIRLTLLELHKNDRRCNKFGKDYHNYSRFVKPLVDLQKVGTVDSVELFQFLDVSTKSEKLVTVLLDIIAIMGTARFASFVESLLENAVSNMTASVQNLAVSDASEAQGSPVVSASHDMTSTTYCSPLDSFWKTFHDKLGTSDTVTHLPSKVAALAHTLSQVFGSVQELQQHWLLTFMLPSAFVRQAKFLFTSKAKTAQGRKQFQLKQLECSGVPVPVSFDLLAVVGDLSFRCQLNVQSSDAWRGWAEFSESNASPLDPSATKLYQNGFQTGDLVRISLKVQNLPHPLRLLAVATGRSLQQSPAERELSRQQYDRAQHAYWLDPDVFSQIRHVALLCTLYPANDDESRELKENVLAAASPEQQALVRTATSFVQLLPCTPALFGHLRKNASMTIVSLTKIYSELLPIEWSQLLDMRPTTACALNSHLLEQLNDSSKPTQEGEADSPLDLKHRSRSIHVADAFLDLTEAFSPSFLQSSSLVFENIPRPSVDEEAELCKWWLTILREPSQASTDRKFWRTLRKWIWYSLSKLSPPLCTSLAVSLTNCFGIFESLLAYVATSACSDKPLAFVQGLVGSGKTFNAAQLVAVLAIFSPLKVLWTAHQNVPLSEAAQQLAAWFNFDGQLPHDDRDAGFSPDMAADDDPSAVVASSWVSIRSAIHRKFRRFLGGKLSATCSVDVAFQRRRSYDEVRFHSISCLLITSGSLIAAAKHEFSSFLAYLSEADLIVFDEAQQGALL